MRRRSRPCRALIVLIGLGVSACGAATSPAPAPVIPKAATSTPLPMPAALPTATAPPPSTPAPCPVRQTVASPDRPASFEDYGVALGRYLAEGGDPVNIAAILSSWDILSTEGQSTAQADLTGDGVPETVVAFRNPLSETFPPEGMLAIYACRGGTVQILYTYRPGEWFGLDLIGTEDLTADGIADLSFAEVSCGANTCWETLHVWSWNGADFQERAGSDLTFPYPTFSVGEGQLLVNSAGRGSVGAGPQRPVTTTLAWDGNGITVTEVMLAPAMFRYHVFRDGDEALFAGDYDRAREAYARALSDDSLVAWAAYTSEDEERQWFNALAHWRLMILDTCLGDLAGAQSHHDLLIADYPPGVAGYPAAVLGQHFWNTYQTGGSVAYSCLDAVNAPETQEALDFLNGFGYANPTYTQEDLCPFLTP